MASWPDLSGNSPITNPPFEQEPGLETYLLFKQGFASLNSAQFVNPSYIDDDITRAIGFSLGDFATVILQWTSIGTGLTSVYEQTFDPTGMTGWFPVTPQIYDTGSNIPSSSSVRTANICYVFPALGCRMRVRVTALTSGAAVICVALMKNTLPPPNNMVVAAVKTSDVANAATANAVFSNLLSTRGNILVVDSGGPAALQTLYTATLGVNTETTMIAANATARNKLLSLCITNDDTVSHTYTIREGAAGNVFRKKVIAANSMWECLLPDCGIWNTAFNRAWTVQQEAAQTTNPSIISAMFFTHAQGS